MPTQLAATDLRLVDLVVQDVEQVVGVHHGVAQADQVL